MTDEDDSRARAVGVNHVALDVGDVEAAVDFYRDLFAFELRGRSESSAFVDMGDQFLALSEGEDAGASDADREADDHRHFGLAVDDPELVERRLDETDAKRLDTGGLDFRDPWGNRVQVVAYEDVQFTKADHVLRGMGLADLDKSDSALDELREKGLVPKE
ncbi:extradiol dioxygenase [Halobacteriales archaeon QS_1_67_19]|nr:MAG: extradiol dioxygenase [Halobacteriales archaeon QS_1_67_19]